MKKNCDFLISIILLIAGGIVVKLHTDSNRITFIEPIAGKSFFMVGEYLLEKNSVHNNGKLDVSYIVATDLGDERIQTWQILSAGNNNWNILELGVNEGCTFADIFGNFELSDYNGISGVERDELFKVIKLCAASAVRKE